MPRLDCDGSLIGWVIPYAIFIKVLLPAPFSPSNATISPGNTSNDTESLATTAPYRLVILRSDSRAIGMSMLVSVDARVVWRQNSALSTPARGRWRPPRP